MFDFFLQTVVQYLFFLHMVTQRLFIQNQILLFLNFRVKQMRLYIRNLAHFFRKVFYFTDHLSQSPRVPGDPRGNKEIYTSIPIYNQARLLEEFPLNSKGLRCSTLSPCQTSDANSNKKTTILNFINCSFLIDWFKLISKSIFFNWV